MTHDISSPARIYLVPGAQRLQPVSLRPHGSRFQLQEVDEYNRHIRYDLCDSGDRDIFVDDVEYGTVAAAAERVFGVAGKHATEQLKKATRAVQAVTGLTYQQAHAVTAEGRLDLIPHGHVTAAKHPGAQRQSITDATWADWVNHVRLGFATNPGAADAVLATGVLLRSGGAKVTYAYRDSLDAAGPDGRLTLSVYDDTVILAPRREAPGLPEGVIEQMLERWNTDPDPLRVAEATAAAVGVDLQLTAFVPRVWCGACSAHVATDHDHDAQFPPVRTSVPPAGHDTIPTQNLQRAAESVGWFDARGWPGAPTDDEVAARRAEVHQSRLHDMFWTEEVAQRLSQVDGIDAAPGAGASPGMVAVIVVRAGDDPNTATESLEVTDVGPLGFFWSRIDGDEVWELAQGTCTHADAEIDAAGFYSDPAVRDAALEQLTAAAKVFATNGEPALMESIDGLSASAQMNQIA